MAGGNHADIFPVRGVFTPVEKDRAAAVIGTIADRRIIQVSLPPDLRVAEVFAAASFREHVCVDHRIRRKLFIVQAITDGYTLGLKSDDLPIAAADISYARIHQQVPTVRHFHCASGEASAAVVIHIRRQCGRETLPADEILRFYMSPMHRAPFGVIRIILKEEMIFSLVRCKAVRIIDPADPAGHMEIRQFGLGIFQILLLKISRLLQHLTDHTVCSCS